MERELLLLGLLRNAEMHGYQLNAFIDSHLDLMVHLKRPTAYRLLDKMADRGWITYHEEREGNRPPRRVFAITPEGEKAFQRLLRTSLTRFEPLISPGNIGLLFLQTLPPAEAVALLQARRAQVEDTLEQVQAQKAHHESASLLLLHQIRHLQAELEWLDEVIDWIQSQEPSGSAKKER